MQPIASHDVSHPIQFKPKHPDSIILSHHDTPHKIATLFLINPTEWKDAWGNHSAPNELRVGDKIKIKQDQDKKYLIYEPNTQIKNRQQHIVLGPQIKVEQAKKERKHQLKYDNFKHFLNKSIILNNQTELKKYPKISELEKSSLFVSINDYIYTKKHPLLNQHQKFNIMRPAHNPYLHPTTKNAVGLRVHYIGEATLDKNYKDGVNCRFRVDLAIQLIKKDDILIPILNDVNPTVINLQSAPIDSVILDFLGESLQESKAGKDASVVILGGTNQKLKLGDLFYIYTPYDCKQLKTIVHHNNNHAHHKPLLQHQNQQVGILMVYRVSNNISYAFILDAKEPITNHAKLGPATMSEIHIMSY